MLKNQYSLEAERARRAYRTLDMIRRYELGELVDAIAADYECGKNTVLRYARAAGLPKRPKCFPTELRNTVIAQLKNKAPYKVIAKACKCSEAYISKLAKAEGLNRYNR